MATLTEVLVALATIAVVGLDIAGKLEVTGDVLANLVLFGVGTFLIGTALDARARSRATAAQERLVDAAETAVGLVNLRQVDASQIGIGLEKLLNASTEWTFKGGSGRYLRHATLPRLSAVRDVQVPVEIQILDPRDLSLCGMYARYRNQHRPTAAQRPDESDPRNIQLDLLANIYAAAWYSARTRITANVLLLRSFSRLRYDIGSTGLFVTVADLREPAIYAASTSWYYKSVLDELRQNTHGHPSIRFPSSADLFPAKLSAEAVRAGLERTEVNDPLTNETSPLLAGPTDPDQVDFVELADRVILENAPF